MSEEKSTKEISKIEYIKTKEIMQNKVEKVVENNNIESQEFKSIFGFDE